MVRLLALMIMFLSSANVIAVAGNEHTGNGPIGDIIVTGQNTSNIISDNQNNNANNNANQNANLNSNSLRVDAMLQAAGFIATPSGNGPADSQISEVFKFKLFDQDGVEAAIEGVGGIEKWNDLIKRLNATLPMRATKKTFPVTSEVSFVYAGSGFEPGLDSKRIWSQGFSIDPKNGEADFVFTEIARKAMQLGATVVYVDPRGRSATESHSGGISAALNFCGLGFLTPALGISSGKLENKPTRIIVNFTMYVQVSQPCPLPPVVVRDSVTVTTTAWWMEYALTCGKDHCPNKCMNNACLRIQAAFDCVLKGQWGQAFEEARIGKEDIIGGTEGDGTKTLNLKASPILLKVFCRIQLFAVRQQFGLAKETELARQYAREYGLRSMPDVIDDLYKNF